MLLSTRFCRIAILHEDLFYGQKFILDSVWCMYIALARLTKQRIRFCFKWWGTKLLKWMYWLDDVDFLKISLWWHPLLSLVIFTSRNEILPFLSVSQVNCRLLLTELTTFRISSGLTCSLITQNMSLTWPLWMVHLLLMDFDGFYFN